MAHHLIRISFRQAGQIKKALDNRNDWSYFCHPMDEPISLKGQDVEFEGEGKGKIVAETDDSIFILSRFFTGWMLKSEYFDLLGVAD